MSMDGVLYDSLNGVSESRPLTLGCTSQVTQIDRLYRRQIGRVLPTEFLSRCFCLCKGFSFFTRTHWSCSGYFRSVEAAVGPL